MLGWLRRQVGPTDDLETLARHLRLPKPGLGVWRIVNAGRGRELQVFAGFSAPGWRAVASVLGSLPRFLGALDVPPFYEFLSPSRCAMIYDQPLDGTRCAATLGSRRFDSPRSWIAPLGDDRHLIAVLRSR